MLTNFSGSSFGEQMAKDTLSSSRSRRHPLLKLSRGMSALEGALLDSLLCWKTQETAHDLSEV